MFSFEQVTFLLVIPRYLAGCPGNTETGWTLLQDEASEAPELTRDQKAALGHG